MKVNIEGKDYEIDETNKELMGIVNTLKLGGTILHKDQGQNFALLNHIILCVQAVKEGKVKELKEKLKSKKKKK